MEVQITFYVFTIRLKNVTVILWHYIKGSGSTTKPIDKLSTGLRSTNTLNINFFSLTYEVFTTSRQSDNWSTPSQYSLLICCRHFSLTNHLFIENHRSLFQICITPSLESTPWFIPSASPVVSFHFLIHLSAHHCHRHHSHHPSLLHFHFRLKTYIFNISFPPWYFFYPGLPSRSQDWLDLSCLSIYSKFVFFLFFSVCSVWWTKLATRQLFTAR